RTEVLRVLNEKQMKIADFNVKPEVLASLVARVDDGKISTTQGKEVFDYMAANNVGVDEAVKSLGITEGGVAGNALAEVIQNVLKANPDVLEEIKSGRDTKGKKLKFLQGLVMKETKGQAKPQEVAAALSEELGVRS
ncbi:MAG: Asp-tRNA(Asn)/Glu-tRNA(Gln) amidotransferase GatCAB subunit B, partial [Synergistaceae bacterium]|nr:Asp-tRNA(Asn)/Glu-tRNA(Gln) amidotransferase GatCAB subunit B [Synergistaceae bacterium]